jgi:hypothetical protein
MGAGNRAGSGSSPTQTRESLRCHACANAREKLIAIPDSDLRPVSCNAGDGEDFAHAARKAAQALRDEINRYR